MLEEMCNLCQLADRKSLRKELPKSQLDRNFELLFTKVKCCERSSNLGNKVYVKMIKHFVSKLQGIGTLTGKANGIFSFCFLLLKWFKDNG